ncbi:MAG TPA: ABC transporter permease [Thermomicrobiales bacterium]|nr:ABC transporter permease [Thermomicrobiales bacterium]
MATTTMAELGTLPRRRSQLGMVIQALRHEPVALIGFIIVAGWLLLALLAPLLPLEDPNFVQLDRKLQSPSWSHPFGTDDVGRDLVSRVIYASRVSVPAGILVVAVTMVIGCTVGAIAGFTGGKVDSFIMRVCDAVLSFPSIILAMAIAAARGGPGLSNAMIAVILVLWPEYARLMRGQVLTLKENEFVTAAKSLGVSGRRVLFRHILPSTDAPIVVKATLDVGAAIVLTAALSFIGIGAVPPTAEWGAMVNQGSKVGLQYWWYSTFPGLAIMSVVMGLNFFGDGLRDALDPRRRRR